MAASIRSSNEAVIRAALSSGDFGRAIELLLDAYQDELYGYCGRFVAPEDLMLTFQRVLVSATEDILSFSGRSTLRASLYQTARITVMHYHRQNRRAFPEALDPAYVPIRGAEDAPGLRLQDDPLRDSLEGLAPQTVEVLQLALWHGLRLDEVAHIVEEPVELIRALAAAGLSQVSVGLTQRRSEPS